MKTPTRLTRSVPFWALIAGSLAAVGIGAWIAVSHIDTMTKTITDGSATGVDVYAGHAWAVLGAVVLGAGLVGLVLALSLSAARVLIPAATAVVEPLDSSVEDKTCAEGETVVEAAPAAELADEAAAVGTPDEVGAAR
ncbi:hypothetical protein [Aeromicrobium wangtongii]|uniref:hypothetical protein n=1 Tax=Aeromicrobium wangtongii TaxID=2969247 RepID=UPI0020183A0F|nr:hypothetical protein [Aeromicrobium wangtongii]MCL3819378.1 hypothetical protein [Aeromicrobium wangtongii]